MKQAICEYAQQWATEDSDNRASFIIMSEDDKNEHTALTVGVCGTSGNLIKQLAMAFNENPGLFDLVTKASMAHITRKISQIGEK